MSDDKTTTLLLIRHAHNPLLDQHRLGGWTPGVHLTDRGRAEAQALGQRLAKAAIAAVYSSPLERAFETAEYVASPHGLAVKTVDGLAESQCGEWTGQPVDEVTKTELWRQFQLFPSTARFPGGESIMELQSRMVAAFEEIRLAHPGQTVALVSHSDPLKTAVAYYIGIPLDLYQRLVVHPASLSELSFTPNGPRLLRCNDCAHIPQP
jgi:probable phosphoglycerate mutase